MAIQVFILIDTTIPSTTVAIVDDTPSPFMPFRYVGKGSGISFIPNETSFELGHSGTKTAVNIPHYGTSGEFDFTEIASFEIDGVNQLTLTTDPAATLQDVVNKCAPHFFV